MLTPAVVVVAVNKLKYCCVCRVFVENADPGSQRVVFDLVPSASFANLGEADVVLLGTALLADVRDPLGCFILSRSLLSWLAQVKNASSALHSSGTWLRRLQPETITMVVYPDTPNAPGAQSRTLVSEYLF